MKYQWLLDARSCPGFLHAKTIAHIEKNGIVHHTEHLHVAIPQRYALVNITGLVADALERSKLNDGFCFVSAMHITAGIYVNDAESGLLHDISVWLENLAPYGRDYWPDRQYLFARHPIFYPH